MILAKLRNRKIHFYSTLIVVFAILAKMLVPIAHASNAQANGEKSFLASLCSGNKVVFVELSLPNNNASKTSTASDGSKCPLCNIIEQHPSSSAITPIAGLFKANPSQLIATNEVLFSHYLTTDHAIRAPPLFS